MAMLAEKRRKTKFVLNPVSKPLWMQESSGMQMGKKLMEKMGWRAGKGLGALEQGIAEPLRSAFKQDSKGMGYKGHGDPFENLDHFNALLASLASNEKDNDVHEFESLEEKSKHSRSRVHYKKFTRGKDVSKYTSSDLSCIVGVGRREEDSIENTEEDIDRMGETENSHGVTTINSGSIADYFKSRLSQRQNTADDQVKLNDTREYITGEQHYQVEEKTPPTPEKILLSDLEDCKQELRKNSKKRKKEGDDNSKSSSAHDDQMDGLTPEPLRHKTKRKKLEENISEPLIGHHSETYQVFPTIEEGHKKKSKDSSKEIPTSYACNDGSQQLINNTGIDLQCENDGFQHSSKIKTKKKKKRKDKVEFNGILDEHDSAKLQIVSEIESCHKKKSKKRSKERSTTDDACIDNDDRCTDQQPGDDSFKLKKKKKKKEKKHHQAENEVEDEKCLRKKHKRRDKERRYSENDEETRGKKKAELAETANLAGPDTSAVKDIESNGLRDIADKFPGSNLVSLSGYGSTRKSKK